LRSKYVRFLYDILGDTAQGIVTGYVGHRTCAAEAVTDSGQMVALQREEKLLVCNLAYNYTVQSTLDFRRMF